MKTVAPFGTWKSPITAELVATSSIGLSQIVLDGPDTYWTEIRPAEGGRYVIVRRSADGQTADVTPPPFNARTLVHEYGGGAYTVADGTVYFANYRDQRLYRHKPGDQPEPITPAAAVRYADLILDRRRHRLICVREDHTREGEAVNTLVAVDLERENAGQILVGGNDFYASPRLSPDGRQLAWLTWNHPNMPWDGTELWLAEVKDDGSLGQARKVAGGIDESIFQPEWSPDGLLHFVSDRTGWWNLYRWSGQRVEPLCEKAAEFGVPQWIFGLSTYAFTPTGELFCCYTSNGSWQLAKLEPAESRLEAIDLPYTHLIDLGAAAGRLALLAASPTEFQAVVELDLKEQGRRVLRRSGDRKVDEGYLSKPQAIEFPTEGGKTAHGIYYPPRNKKFQGPAGEKPPLLVISHGGPTSATRAVLSWGMQFWTSRGIAVLDVNYGGSTGYGREYRDRLKGQWGVVDVDDCINGARSLVERGLADGERVAIRGGSAGGYTTLCALTFRDFFKAGASYFGLSDLEVFVRDTHKFESRYLDSLVGPYPERAELYRQRSAIHHVEDLSSPMILLQGLEDKIVPPNQAELMLEAVRKKGLPVAYLPFEGEQHGFRRAENIRRAHEAELYFYGKVFGFEIADQVEPVPIENL